MAKSIEKVIGCFSKDFVLKQRNKLGLCRIWTGRVLDLVKGLDINELELTAEAREVQVEPGLHHTFVRITLGEKSYLWDGIGTGKYGPYFGLEDQAPEHLKNSHLDMINRVRNSD